MNRKSLALSLALAVFVLIATVFSVSAQTRNTSSAKTSAAATAPSTAAPLYLLPPSDLIITVNIKRWINEALPKFFSDNPAKLAEFNAEIDKIKTQTGIDVHSFENVAVGVRYQHPSPNITTTDEVAIVQGSFNAGAYLAAARLAAKGKYREEQYQGATIYIINVNDQVNLSGLFKMKVSELAVTSLGSDTLIFGEPASIRATLDANKRPSRVNDALIQLATRTPDALIGFGANVPTSLTATADFGNPEITKIIASIRQAYGSVSTTANGFGFLAIARTETPDEARTLSQTLAALKQFGAMVIPQLPPGTGKIAQNALDNLKIESSGNETSLNLELSQADISTLMHNTQSKPGSNP